MYALDKKDAGVPSGASALKRVFFSSNADKSVSHDSEKVKEGGKIPYFLGRRKGRI